MNVRYRVELSQAERDELTTMLSKGACAARMGPNRRRRRLFVSTAAVTSLHPQARPSAAIPAWSGVRQSPAAS